MTIKFGTSGWRGLIARDFTFTNVRFAAQGIAEYLKAELADSKSAIHGRKPVVIIGHDTRFLGREFSLAVAEVLAANGLIPLLCQRDAPTPVIARAAGDRHEWQHERARVPDRTHRRSSAARFLRMSSSVKRVLP